MGVLRSVNAALPKQPEPTGVYGGSVASEPAYSTSLGSTDVCAPPGLAMDDPLMSELDQNTCLRQMLSDLLGEYSHSPSAPQYIDLGYDVGNVLKVSAAYDHQKTTQRAREQEAPRPAAAASFSQKVQDFDQDVMPGDDSEHLPRRHLRRRKRTCVLRLATHLNQLEHEDPSKVVIVRKINRLGFESSNILKEHYASIGAVSKVLLSNQHERQSGLPFQVRLRPSGIAFLVFETVEGAARALAQGATQTVAGVEIFVRAFEKRLSDEDEDAGECGNGTP